MLKDFWMGKIANGQDQSSTSLPHSPRTKKKFTLKLKKIVVAVLLLLLAPLLLLIISGISYVASFGALIANKGSLYKPVSSVAKRTLAISATLSSQFSQLPIIRKFGVEYVTLSSLVQVGFTAGDALSVVATAPPLTGKATEELLMQVSLQLKMLYEQVSFLEAEVDNGAGILNRLLAKSFSKPKFANYKKDLQVLGNLNNFLPQLLGTVSPKTYLLVFVDENTLSPGGGLIDSIALVSLANGKIVDMRGFSFEEVLTNAKGEIVPPPTFETHLGKDNLQYIEGGWLTNFKDNASDLTQLVSPSTGEGLDGVVQINKHALNALLQVVGSVELQSKARVVNEIGEADTDLAEIAKGLLAESQGLPRHKLLKLGKAVYDQLERKHVLLSFTDALASEAVTSFGWSDSGGEVACGANCIFDKIEVADTFLKENSKPVTRSAYLQEVYSETQVSKSVTITYNAISDSKIPVFGRLVVAKEADPQPVEILTGDEKEVKEPVVFVNEEEKEITVDFDLKGGGQTSITYSWKEPVYANFASNGKYVLSWRKQPGVVETLYAKINFPDAVELGGWLANYTPSSSLTNSGIFSYNSLRQVNSSTLSQSPVFGGEVEKDLVLTNFWIPK